MTFDPLGETSTHVVLEHRHLERHGAGWESMRTAVGAADGWAHDLTKLAEVLGQRP